jgi:glutamine synthetase
MLTAALDGIDNELPAPKPLNDVNVYELTSEERRDQGIKELPGSLAESLRALDEDAVLKEALGTSIYNAFLRAKWAEVEDYRMRVTDWELERYLEVA